MKISECMSPAVEIASPEDTIQKVARTLREIDAGSMPVGENDRLVGMITDRDIAIRAVADGLGPETKVRGVMTEQMHYCFEDDDVEEVSDRMGNYKVRRLPVLNREKRLTGIVSLGDLSRSDVKSGGAALTDISQPGGLHSHH